MVNSVDPDQTAVCSGSALFAYAILSATLVYKILRTFTVTINTCILLSYIKKNKVYMGPQTGNEMKASKKAKLSHRVITLEVIHSPCHVK